jgi:hypothetical protein
LARLVQNGINMRTVPANGQDDERDGDGEPGTDGIGHDEEDAEDRIEIDEQEEAMLDLFQHCQDAGTSLQFFD